MEDFLYKKLLKMYSEHVSIASEYFDSIRNAAFQFRETLEEKIGFPDSMFETRDGLRHWVRIFDVIDNRIDKNSDAKLDQWDDQGNLRFAVGVALSSSLESFPKRYLWIAYDLSRNGDSLVLQEVFDRNLKFIISDEAGMTDAVSSFVNTLQQWLTEDPKDFFKPKRGIGFY